MPAQNIENEVCEAQGSPKRVLWHFHIRALIRNDHPQTSAQNRVIFHVVRGRTCAYLSISAHICTYLTYLRASGESARIWRTCAYLSISAHICTYLATAASWPLQRSWTLQLLLPGLCNAPGRCNCCFLAYATAPATLPERCFRIAYELQDSIWAKGLLPASATLLDAATAASSPMQRSCNAPGRCNCCFLASMTLLQRSQTLQLLLPRLC
jgi:hypothetical protein